MNKVNNDDDESDDVNKCPGGVVILENSPVGESQSNGMVERAIKEIQHQIRKLKMQLEENMNQKLNNDSPIWPWLIQYAAQIIHAFIIHREDKGTSRQRIRADPSLPDILKNIPKEEGRWRSGIWMGFVDSSNEHIAGTSKGVLKCRAIRRHDVTEQFDASMIDSMKGTPWQPVPG